VDTKRDQLRPFFSLIALLIAIPLAGISYQLLATILSFLPGENWENFVGFLVALGIIILISHFLFLLPRLFIQKAWGKGIPFRIVGGIFNTLNAATGMVVFTLLVGAYPVMGWLEDAVAGSGVLSWLVAQLDFVQAMLPPVFHIPASTIAARTLLSSVIP
jgi:hypothetical protein